MEAIKETEEIEDFISSNENAHFLQSPEWAKVKKDWKNEIIVAKDKEGKVVGSMSILLKKIPFLKYHIMYAPRGFVCDYNDELVITYLTIKAKELANKYNAFIFRLDPCIEQSDEKFKEIITSLGFKTKENIKSVDDVIQPKYVMRLNLKGKNKDEIMNGFHTKTRYNIRLAIKKGVIVREGTEKDINIFYRILRETAKRDNFVIREKSYYERVYTALGKEHAKILIAECEKIPIAVAMPILYGNKVWYLYGGSKTIYRNLMPTYLLQWEMIKWAISNNCDTYDFRGVTGYDNLESPQYGVYRFKKGFGGEVVEFIDELNMVFHPIVNFCFEQACKLLAKLHMLNKK